MCVCWGRAWQRTSGWLTLAWLGVAGFDDVVAEIVSLDTSAEVLFFYEPDQELWLETARQRLLAHPRMVGVVAVCCMHPPPVEARS